MMFSVKLFNRATVAHLCPIPPRHVHTRQAILRAALRNFVQPIDFSKQQ